MVVVVVVVVVVGVFLILYYSLFSFFFLCRPINVEAFNNLSHFSLPVHNLLIRGSILCYFTLKCLC